MKIDYKRIIFWAIVIIIILGLIFLIIRYVFGEKKLEIIYPQGGEEIRAGQSYTVRWESKNINKVGILLIKGMDLTGEKWIVRDIPAGSGRYDWHVFAWEQTGQDYRIAIVEYPWEEEKEITYSEDFFSIIGPDFASCYQLIVSQDLIYLPSDFPDQRKIFLTSNRFSGNLGGLEGADQKCQEEAMTKNLEGTWKAFLGDDNTFAFNRVETDGIIVDANIAANLPEGKTCHKFLAKDFDTFYQTIFRDAAIAEEKFGISFFNQLADIWLGKIDKDSPENCVFIEKLYPPYHYSFTSTCQNWTTNRMRIAEYPLPEGQTGTFPMCYTIEGDRIEAVGIAGLSSGFKDERINFSLAHSCNTSFRLLCVEQ